MQTGKLSISDLAQKLNVSKTTVSFILNGKGPEKRISVALIEKVKKEAAKSGYHPNPFAKSLRTGKTNIIGLMVEDISNPFYASIAKLIEDKVYLNGYRIIYCSTENDKNRGREFLNMFETLGVDGCIIVPTPGMETEIAAMIQRGKHIVLFDKTFGSKLAADRVVINNRQSMYQAVEHLVERGFENIGLVAITVEEAKNEERIIGYKRAISQHKMVSYAYALPFKTRYADYVKAIRKILRDNKKLDAIIFGTNYLGVAGLEAIRQMKLTIPKDLAVVVFDDHDLFRIHQPAISVISQPIVEIAQAVIDTLLSKLHKGPGKKKAQTITLSTSLIIRQSS